MNLCGIVPNEPEQLVLQIPDEKFQLTPRRKASSSAPSRRRKDRTSVESRRRRTSEERRSVDSGRRGPSEERRSSYSRSSSDRNSSRRSHSSQGRSNSSSHRRSHSSQGRTPSSHGRSHSSHGLRNSSQGRLNSSQNRSNSSQNRSTSSSHNRTHSSRSPSGVTNTTFRNQISKNEVQKSTTRQRTPGSSSQSSKSTLGLIKKLESGFSVAMLGSDGEKRRIFLDVDPDRSNLRLRLGHEEINSSTGYGNANSDFKLRVMDIARLEVGREKSTKRGNSSHKPLKTFSIVMRSKTGEMKTFNFEAESPPERDSIILGIKSVLELSKIKSQDRRRRRKAVTTPAATPSHDSKRQTEKTLAEKHLKDSFSGRKSASYFDFDVSIDKEMRADSSGRSSIRSDSRRANASNRYDHDSISGGGIVSSSGSEYAIVSSSGSGSGSASASAHTSGSSTFYSSQSSDYESEKRGHKASNELAITATANNVIEIAGKNWSVDDIFCGIGNSGEVTPYGSKHDRSSTMGTDVVLREMKHDKALHKAQGWNPLGGCNSEALAAVEDVEIAMAANEVSAGPFCTDDVCTAGLKDFTDAMKGIFETNQSSNRDGKPDAEKQRALAEEYITGVLGAPTTVANLLLVKDMWATAEAPVRRNKVLRNRSRALGAQAARWARLRKQMTFEAANSGEKIPFVQIVSSYDDIDRAGRFGKKLTSKEIMKPPRGDSSQFLKSVVEETHVQQSLYDQNSEILYYDSDPEDARESAVRRGPRRTIAERENMSPRAKPRREALSGITLSRTSLSKRLRRGDDEVVTEIVDAIKNEKLTLMWHPTQTTEIPNRTPFCAKAWIEAGVYLIDGTFLLPKFTWVPISEGAIKSRILNVTLSNPGTIDLLDVCRVRECTKIDRKSHPFARVDRSFIIQTQKEVQLFEAQSKEERNRIVNGLRLVIARLASLLMLRDLRAVDEFFGGNNSVPGEAPAWAKGKTDKSNDGTPSFPK